MSRRRRHASFLTAGAAVVLGVTLLLARESRLPWWVAYLVAVNATTLVLYGYDKLAAPRKRRFPRVPERDLHLFALLGGSPAAWVAQELFRHKRVKGRFRRVFWGVLALQLAVLGWALWYRYG